MSRRPSPTALGVGLAYATNGFSMAAWSARLPDIGAAVGVGAGGLATFLLANAVGTLAVVTVAGWIVERRGARWGYALATAVFAAAYVILGLAALSGNFAMLLVGGVVHGAAFALTNVPQGILGADVEARAGRTTVPVFHACYSLAGAVGAALGGVAAVIGVPVGMQFLALAVLAVALRIAARSLVQVDAGRFVTTAGSAERPPEGDHRVRSVWRDGRVLLLGGIVFAATLSESGANNWIAVALVDAHGAEAAVGAAALSVFLVAQTAGRLLAGPIVDHVGRPAAVLASTVIAAVGVVLVASAPSVTTALVAAGVWGLGAALAVPVSMSAAAARPRGAASVAAVAAVASLATVIGPAVVGAVAEAIDVRLALLCIAAVLALSAPLSAWAYAGASRPGRRPVPPSTVRSRNRSTHMSRVHRYMTEQPEALARARRAWDAGTVRDVRMVASGIERLIFVGSGTSSFAARAVRARAAALLPGLEIHALTPSDILVRAVAPTRLGEGALVVAVSQSGRSLMVRDAVAAARSAGAATAFVTGEPTLAPEVDVVIDISSGPEEVGAKTKGYTTTVLALLRLVYALADRDAEPEGLDGLSAAAARALGSDHGTLASFAGGVTDREGLHLIGAGGQIATVQEAALKIVEIALVNATATDVEEFAHGPHRRITAASSAVVVATAGPMLARAVALESWLRAAGASTLVVTDQPRAFTDTPRVIALDVLPEDLAVIPAVIPLQMLALALAEDRGLSPDAVLHPEIDTVLSRKAHA